VSRRRLGRILWIGTAAVLVAAALIALAAILRGRFSDNDGRIIITLVALLYSGSSALAGLALLDRGTTRPLGWAAAVAAPIGLAFMAWGIWSFVWEGEGSETAGKLAWSWVLGLAASLIATTSLLLARRALVSLAAVAGALAALAAALSIIGVWTEPGSDAYVKAVAALWILAALAYFLVPVLQRFTAAGAEPEEVRVLATLGDVELVATRAPVDGGVAVEQRPRPGERLLLRRIPRADGT
jgi:hypothetical protein